MIPYTTNNNVKKIVNEALEEGEITPSKESIIPIVNEAIENGEIVNYEEIDLSDYLTIEAQSQLIINTLMKAINDSTGKDFVDVELFSPKLDLNAIKADVIKLKIAFKLDMDDPESAESIIYLRRTTEKFIGLPLISFITSGYFISTASKGASFQIGISNSSGEGNITAIARRLDMAE